MDPLTSAVKSQLMGGNSITSQTPPLSPPACANRRPYSVESAYRCSLVAEPTVVPSPASSQAHYSHKHDGCKWFECETVGAMERRELAGAVCVATAAEEPRRRWSVNNTAYTPENNPDTPASQWKCRDKMSIERRGSCMQNRKQFAHERR